MTDFVNQERWHLCLVAVLLLRERRGRARSAWAFLFSDDCLIPALRGAEGQKGEKHQWVQQVEGYHLDPFSVVWVDPG